MVVVVVFLFSSSFLFFCLILLHFTGIACTSLSIPTSLGLLSCVYSSFLLSSIYGFQFQVSGSLLFFFCCLTLFLGLWYMLCLKVAG